jgi:hypothetical protein
VAGKARKPGGKAATARSNAARWCVGTRKRIARSYPLFRRSIFGDRLKIFEEEEDTMEL